MTKPFSIIINFSFFVERKHLSQRQCSTMFTIRLEVSAENFSTNDNHVVGRKTGRLNVSNQNESYLPVASDGLLCLTRLTGLWPEINAEED